MLSCFLSVAPVSPSLSFSPSLAFSHTHSFSQSCAQSRALNPCAQSSRSIPCAQSLDVGVVPASAHALLLSRRGDVALTRGAWRRSARGGSARQPLTAAAAMPTTGAFRDLYVTQLPEDVPQPKVDGSRWLLNA